MTEILAALLGTIVGGFISWISNVYQSKSQATFDFHREFDSDDMNKSRIMADHILKKDPNLMLDEMYEKYPEESFHIWQVINFYRRLWVAIKYNQIKKTSGIIGSKNYMSINSHNHIELSRRDDLESIGYMLLYLYNGTLDWNNESNEIKILNMKQNVLNYDNIPNVIINYIKLVKSLDYTETPNYNLIIDEFKKEIELTN